MLPAISRKEVFFLSQLQGRSQLQRREVHLGKRRHGVKGMLQSALRNASEERIADGVSSNTRKILLNH
jgi:hypothetical protein